MDLIVREVQEEREKQSLSPDALYACDTEGRAFSSQQDILRTDFQRDRDKIIHSKAFRRLSHKTQVFVAVEGDHFRTRLTHTLEVAQIARVIARALNLNEDLTEAIALGHDLGHTPFGHTGEEALCQCLAKTLGLKATDPIVHKLYQHNLQSLRVVECLEQNGKGLNLCSEVKDGIVHHTGSVRAETLEGRIVAIADRIAYVNHDLDDALRAGILHTHDIPEEITRILGETHSERIECLVLDMVTHSQKLGDIALSHDIGRAMNDLRTFLFKRVYYSDPVMHEVKKAHHVVCDLFFYFMEHPEEIPEEFRDLSPYDPSRAVCDYIAGMTDRYAKALYQDLFIPSSHVKIF